MAARIAQAGVTMVFVVMAACLPPSASLPVDTGLGPEVYHTWLDLTADLAVLAQLHPDIARWSSIGKSNLGLDLWALEITDFAHRDGSEPVVVIDGGHHGNEPLGMELPYAAVLRLLTHHDDDPVIRALVDGVDLHFLPSVNPDGNLLDTRKNAMQVDLNRNYPDHWGCSQNIASATYCGPAAGSEPETQAMMVFFTAVRPDLDISGHTGIKVLLHPYGWTTAPPPDHAIYEQVGAEFRQVTGIRSAQVTQEVGIAKGGSIDWVYAQLGTLAWAFEVDDEQNQRLSVQDLETRFPAQLRGYFWFLENAARIRGLVQVTGAEAAQAQDGTWDVRVTLANPSLSAVAVRGTLEPGDAPVRVAAGDAEALLPPGAESVVAFAVEAAGPGAGNANLRLAATNGRGGAWTLQVPLQVEVDGTPRTLRATALT